MLTDFLFGSKNLDRLACSMASEDNEKLERVRKELNQLLGRVQEVNVKHPYWTSEQELKRLADSFRKERHHIIYSICDTYNSAQDRYGIEGHGGRVHDAIERIEKRADYLRHAEFVPFKDVLDGKSDRAFCTLTSGEKKKAEAHLKENPQHWGFSWLNHRTRHEILQAIPEGGTEQVYKIMSACTQPHVCVLPRKHQNVEMYLAVVKAKPEWFFHLPKHFRERVLNAATEGLVIRIINENLHDFGRIVPLLPEKLCSVEFVNKIYNESSWFIWDDIPKEIQVGLWQIPSPCKY